MKHPIPTAALDDRLGFVGSLNVIGVTWKPQTGHIALSDWAQELLAA